MSEKTIRDAYREYIGSDLSDDFFMFCDSREWSAFRDGYLSAKKELEEQIREAKEVIEHYKDICSCSFGCNCNTAKAYLEKWK